MNRAVPRSAPEREPNPVRKYRVLSRRCVWGKKGEIIEKAFNPDVERSLFSAGTLELAPETPEFVATDEPEDRPLKSAEQEG